jgi:hypothetical protein
VGGFGREPQLKDDRSILFGCGQLSHGVTGLFVEVRLTPFPYGAM